MDISIVIPVKNEEKTLTKLYQQIIAVLGPLQKSFEIIFIDDGSTDSSFEILKSLSLKDNRVQIIKFRRNFGKSAALMAGFRKAQGEIVFTMDADLQDDPTEIPSFLAKIKEGYDLVSGWKAKRYDPVFSVFCSRIFNWVSSKLTGVTIHDTVCGFKTYKKEVLQHLNLYGELYRFIPALAAQKGFKTAEIKVKHHPREFGKSKYGIEKFLKGFLDLITIVFLTGYLKRPGHFFGGIGIISLAIGFIINFYIAYLRITTGSIQWRYPLLFLGVLLMIVGIQFISTGLLAEMFIYFNRQKEDEYVIEKD